MSVVPLTPLTSGPFPSRAIEAPRLIVSAPGRSQGGGQEDHGQAGHQGGGEKECGEAGCQDKSVNAGPAVHTQATAEGGWRRKGHRLHTQERVSRYQGRLVAS